MELRDGKTVSRPINQLLQTTTTCDAIEATTTEVAFTFTPSPDRVITAEINDEHPVEVEDATRRGYRNGRPQISLGDLAAVIKPFTGKQHDSADRWIKTFHLYTKFKNIPDEMKTDLFKLLMAEDAADWVTTHPGIGEMSFDELAEAFSQRFGLSEAQKWRAESDLWRRQQGPTETVDQYVTDLRLKANRVAMAEEQLIKIILQGIRPELRLFVLNAKCKTITHLLEVARTCEAARAADTNTNTKDTNIEALTSMVGTLMDRVSELTRQSTFTQAALGNQQQPRVTHRNGGQGAQRGQPTGQYHRQTIRSTSGQDQRPRYPEQQPHQSAPWRTQRPSQPTWRQQSTRQQTPSSTNHPAGNIDCDYCGRRHEFGKQYCPAANLTCFNCGRLGHVQRVCHQSHRGQNTVHQT